MSALATNVTWHDGEVSRAERNSLLGQVGVTVWFTGLSGSGNRWSSCVIVMTFC